MNFHNKGLCRFGADSLGHVHVIYINTLYRTSFVVLYSDQQMHNYFTNYHTPTVVPSWPDRIHTHHGFKITLPNTDQAHDKISVNHYQ